MSRQRSPAFLGALGLFLGLLTVATFAAPRVTGFDPTSQSPHVSSTSFIRLTFNRPMDQVSVESRFATVPEVPGTLTWRENVLTFKPFSPWPLGSDITVSLAPGARSTAFLPILSSLSWSFQIGGARVGYLWPSNGPAELYLQDVDDGVAVRVTETEAGVIDYSDAGSLILYSALRGNGDSEIRSLNLSTGEDSLILECLEPARCQAPALAPNEQLLVYEQFEWQSSESGQRVPGVSEIRLLPLAADGASTAISPNGQSMTSPIWSPEGLLAFYNVSLGAITLLEPADTQPVNIIPNGLGLLGSWSPDGQYLIVPEIVFPSESGEGHDDQAEFFSHLYRLTASSSEVIDLSSGMVEDASPAYSPDGSWIAFARKYLDSRWTPGRQLWLMRSDATQARPLTDDPDFSHSSIAWSPNSAMLAYMRLNQADTNLQPEIWIMDLAEENHQLLVVGGYLPRWMP
jgi:Tol biopolymer transport system component